MRKPTRMIYQTDETRSLILEVAEALFAEKGFAATQMKDVAAAANISRASLYRYYRDKVDLGFAALEMVAEKFSEQFGSLLTQVDGRNARERLMCIALQIADPDDFQTENRFVAEFDAFFSSSNIPEDFSHRLPSLHEELVMELRQIARQGFEDGSIRDDLTAAEVVNLVIFPLRTAQHMLLLRSEALSTFSAKEKRSYLHNLSRVISDGLKPQ